MMRLATFCLLATAVLAAQDLLTLADQLQAAIDAGDWKKAAEISSSLKDKVAEARNRAFNRDDRQQMDSILNWLPEDTETVIVSHEPFKLEESNPHMEADALTAARGYVLGLLGAPDDGKLFKAVDGSTLRFGLLAARRFGLRKADSNNILPLGMIDYQGCALYRFAKPVAETALVGGSATVIMGQPAWISKGGQSDQGGEIYLVALPKPDLLLACNDRDFFSSIVSRMTAPVHSRALPQSLPEWKQIDRSAPLWGLRHFIPDHAKTDPSYPRKESMSGIADEAVTGVVIQVGLPTDRVQGRWLSKSKTNPWQKIADAPDFHGAAHTRKVSDGLWELSVTGPPGHFAVFVLMAVLGFVVLV